ncbi:MAG TPA: UPF0758 domain-containing protein, partial [Hanamia sp.]|nr:UPF0758 domain-containing protein [Hanamia sp.]
MESVNKSSTSIKNWALDDRPREKLVAKGRESLSDSELLAILINSGSGKDSAVDLAKKILRLGDDNLDELGKITIKEMMSIKGIGTARAITLVAALELGRRRSGSLMHDKKR